MGQRRSRNRGHQLLGVFELRFPERRMRPADDLRLAHDDPSFPDHRIEATASIAASAVTRSAYFCPMSNRFARCGSKARSPTQSVTTTGRKFRLIASTTVARTQPLVVQPATTTVSMPLKVS